MDRRTPDAQPYQTDRSERFRPIEIDESGKKTAQYGTIEQESTAAERIGGAAGSTKSVYAGNRSVLGNSVESWAYRVNRSQADVTERYINNAAGKDIIADPHTVTQASSQASAFRESVRSADVSEAPASIGVNSQRRSTQPERQPETIKRTAKPLKAGVYGYRPRSGKYRRAAEGHSKSAHAKQSKKAGKAEKAGRTGVGTTVRVAESAAINAVLTDEQDASSVPVKSLNMWRNTRIRLRRVKAAARATMKAAEKAGQAVKSTIKRIWKIVSNPFTMIFLAILIIIVLLVAIIGSIVAIIPNISLKSDDKEITKAYEYVTMLDSALTMELQEAVTAATEDDVRIYVNGYESSPQALKIETNPDTILLYFDCKYEDYAFDAFIYGLFGGDNIKDEIAAIHDSLYSYTLNRWTEVVVLEDGEEKEVSHLDVNLSVKNFDSFLYENGAEFLTEQDQARFDAMKEVGIYTVKAELGSPFVGKSYYVSKRFGFCYENGTASHHSGIDIFMPSGTPINNVLYGTVTETSSNSVTIAHGSREVRYMQLGSVAVSAGQTVDRGTIIGTVGINSESGSSELHLEYYIEDGFCTNPAFFLTGLSMAGSGYGDDDIVAVAASQVGNVNGQPYWSWYGFASRVDWCACFVSWCANECGYIDAGIIPKFSYCPAGDQWFQSRGLWQNGGGSYIPKKGDIIFFDYEPNGESNHVGIVESCDGTTVYTIEGNSGNCCKRIEYSIYSAQIMGYGTPAYTTLKGEEKP